MHAPETNSETASHSNAALNLYDIDFYAWTQEQASLLRNQQWSQIDVPNLVEEIESLGKQQRQELRNCLAVLIGHLLKWEYQSQRRSRSWLATIDIQRLDIAALLKDNPSLKPYLEEALDVSYLKGVKLAIGETDLSRRAFPPTCLYRLAEILDDRFYPGKPSDLVAELDN